jgi:hypothetical protein
MMWTLDFKQHL